MHPDLDPPESQAHWHWGRMGPVLALVVAVGGGLCAAAGYTRLSSNQQFHLQDTLLNTLADIPPMGHAESQT